MLDEIIIPWLLDEEGVSKTILVGDTIESDGRFVLHVLISQILRPSVLVGAAASSSFGRGGGEGTTRYGGKVLWLSGGPWTPILIAQSLKKMNVSVNKVDDDESSRFKIRSILEEFNQFSGIDNDDESGNEKNTKEEVSTSHSKDDDDQHNNNPYNKTSSTAVINSNNNTTEVFLQRLFHEIKTWLTTRTDGQHDHQKERNGDEGASNSLLQQNHESPPSLSSQMPSITGVINESTADDNKDIAIMEQQSISWIVLDDVSTLATVLGERLVYQWILSIHDLACRYDMGLFLRYSIDEDHQRMLRNDSNDVDIFSKASAPMIENFFIGLSSNNIAGCGYGCWEQSLIEFADLVLDVLPFESGPSREAHGRIICTWLQQPQPPHLLDDDDDDDFHALSTISTASTNTRHTTPQSNHMVCTYCLMDNKVTTRRIL